MNAGAKGLRPLGDVKRSWTDRLPATAQTASAPPALKQSQMSEKLDISNDTHEKRRLILESLIRFFGLIEFSEWYN